MSIERLSPRRAAVFFLWSAGFWMVLALLSTADQVVTNWIHPDSPAGYEIHVSSLLLVTAARFISFAVLTPPIFYLVRRFPIGRRSILRTAGAYLLGAVPFVVLYATVRWSVAPVWSYRLGHFCARSFRSWVGIVTGTLDTQISVYAALLIAAHAWEYFDRARTQELARSELQKALAASELQALKSQLHPHFLFNTLHGISTLADSNAALAKAMVIKLARLLRLAIQHASSDLITLDDELSFINDYLDLEKMRLGSRLDVRWQIAPETQQALVPQLILQPLVENAILHGISCQRDGGWLEISARRAAGMVEITVENRVGEARQGGLGLGLANTRSRLQHLYSGEATLSFSIGNDRRATAMLLLPVFEPRGVTRKETPRSQSTGAPAIAGFPCRSS